MKKGVILIQKHVKTMSKISIHIRRDLKKTILKHIVFICRNLKQLSQQSVCINNLEIPETLVKQH